MECRYSDMALSIFLIIRWIVADIMGRLTIMEPRDSNHYTQVITLQQPRAIQNKQLIFLAIL